MVALDENTSIPQSRLCHIHQMIGTPRWNRSEKRAWTAAARTQLRQWKDIYLRENSSPLQLVPSFIGGSDASDTGMGFIWHQGRSTRRQAVPVRNIADHITVKELSLNSPSKRYLETPPPSFSSTTRPHSACSTPATANRETNLPDNSIDLVITDPPYKNYQNPGKTKQTKISSRNFSPEVLINHMERVLKSGCHFYIFCDHMTFPEFFRIIEKSNSLVYKNMIVWANNNRGTGDLTGNYAPTARIDYFWSEG